MKDKGDVFYQDGLCFECTRCHNCCRHDPGYVFLTKSDLSTLAKGCNLSVEDFQTTYCRTVKIGLFDRLSLNEKPNYDCVFWVEDGCSVYKHRPVQCRTYPFWSSNLISREIWDEEGKSCPGINHGTPYKRRQIDKIVKMREIEPLLP